MKVELDNGVAEFTVKKSKVGTHTIGIQLPKLEFTVPFDPQTIHPVKVADCLPDAIHVFVTAFKTLLGRELLQAGFGLLGSDGEPVSAPKQPSETSNSEGTKNG